MDAQQIDRQALLQKLLDAVKQCQVQFGGKSVLATEKDSSVLCLVSQFEQALQHGLKKNKLIEKLGSLTEPLRQVTQKIIPEIDITFWSVVKEILNSMDLKHFESMEGITTDSGRARCWLRSSLNEHSLERHLNAVLADINLISQFYEPWSVLRDGEISSTLPTMARGLSSIIFAMDIKSEELNKPFKMNTVQVKTHEQAYSNPLPVFAGFDTEPAITKKINNMKKKKKRRKVVEATISDLEDIPGEAMRSQSLGEYNSSSPVSPASSHLGAFSDDDDGSESEIGTFHTFEARVTSVNPPAENTSYEDHLKLNGDCRIDNKEYFDREKPSLNNQQLFPTESVLHHSTVDDTVITESKNVSVSRQFHVSKQQVNNDISEQQINTIVQNIHKEDISNSPSGDEIINTLPRNIANADTSLNLLHVNLNGDVPTNENSNGDVPRNENSCSSSIRSEESDVGSDASKYIQLFMAYDQESSQAATDTMALITSSFEPVAFEPATSNSSVSEETTSTSEMDKYIPQTKTTDNQPSEDLSSVDLKQAILATVKKKDEVEERCRVLQIALDDQRELVNVLQSENERLENESKTRQVHDHKKISALTREVEVLKNQLKKYVAAVQTLRREHSNSAINEDIANLRLNNDDVAMPTKERERTTSENDSIFEEKLCQMAEMHGELMEFQENLQRQLVFKDSCISRMKQELIALRGPLPHEIDHDMTSSCHTSQESLYTMNRPLINIWIPSVFLKGKGTEAHHLYQIYIRVGDEEWNVYRRYSQFNKFHSQMSKLYAEIEKFNFPKKKMFGKKDTKFVEVRRRRLQDYLRLLINSTLSCNKELSSQPSKNLLLKALPLFGENFEGNEDRRKQKSAPVYTGLTSFPAI